MSDDNAKRLDDILKRAQAAQNASAPVPLPKERKLPGFKPRSPSNENTAQELLEDVRDTLHETKRTMKFVNDLRDAGVGAWNRFLKPVWDVVGFPLRLGWSAYRGLWNAYAFDKDKETGEKNLNKGKAGILLAASFAAAVAATPTLPGEMVRYFTTEPVMDAVSMSLTMKHNEVVYNMKSHVIDAAAGTYNVEGCHKPTACNAGFTKTFKLEERLSHTIWNTAVNGHPFFMTDRIAAAIPQGNNRCEVTSYSARLPIMKYFHIFPKMLDVECSPMNNGVVLPPPAPAA